MLILLGALPAFAATFTVTSTSDSGPGSLRDTIASAANGDTITFSLTYPVTIAVTAPLTLGTSLTIVGPGASNLVISGADSVGVLIVNGGATVAISGLAIGHGSSVLGAGIFNAGRLTLTDSTVSNNIIGTQLGAGIFNAGTLTLTNASVSGNFVNDPAGGRGIGIYNSHGTLTLTNSTVSGNSGVGNGSYEGGGIFNDNGVVTLTNSTVLGNILGAEFVGGDARGGGISNVNSGSLTLTNSTVSGNTVIGTGNSTGGGGIWNGTFPAGPATVTLVKSTVSDNATSGGLPGGGGITNNGFANVINSTIAGNSVSFGGSGGGIKNNIGETNLIFSTMANNTASLASGSTVGGIDNATGNLTVKNSIVANNPGGNCSTTPGISEDLGHNLSDDTTCATTFNDVTDLNGIPAGLDPGGLKNNGGPTQTIALLPTSAALNVIPVLRCADISGTPIPTDQRGVSRPQGPACDIGSFEFFQSRFPIQAVETFLLIGAVQTSPLPSGPQQGLIAPLQAAIDSMNRGNVNAATGQLGAFINQVNTFVQSDKLTTEEGAALTTPAQAVIQSLNGS